MWYLTLDDLHAPRARTFSGFSSRFLICFWLLCSTCDEPQLIYTKLDQSLKYTQRGRGKGRKGRHRFVFCRDPRHARASLVMTPMHSGYRKTSFKREFVAAAIPLVQERTRKHFSKRKSLTFFWGERWWGGGESNHPPPQETWRKLECTLLPMKGRGSRRINGFGASLSRGFGQ